jgi:hypothetical protein
MKRGRARRCLAAAGAALLWVGTAVHSGEQKRWDRYVNARFQYSVEYPADLLKPQPEAENGDGRRFTGIKSGRGAPGYLQMLVYGSHNIDGRTLKDHFDEAAAGDPPSQKVTFKKRASNWYVVSGTIAGPEGGRQQRIFYTKTILRDDVFKTLHLEYDVFDKKRLDPVVTRISRSFKG